jgi:hypothetical protein
MKSRQGAWKNMKKRRKRFDFKQTAEEAVCFGYLTFSSLIFDFGLYLRNSTLDTRNWKFNMTQEIGRKWRTMF